MIGSRQDLPNDTLMVVVPGEGRVLETSWEGELSFEFNNVFSADYTGHVANAVWLPLDHFDELPSCPDD